MKPSELIKKRYCTLCTETKSLCEHCCVVADIIGDLEGMEEEVEDGEL